MARGEAKNLNPSFSTQFWDKPGEVHSLLSLRNARHDTQDNHVVFFCHSNCPAENHRGYGEEHVTPTTNFEVGKRNSVAARRVDRRKYFSGAMASPILFHA